MLLSLGRTQRRWARTAMTGLGLLAGVQPGWGDGEEEASFLPAPEVRPLPDAILVTEFMDQDQRKDAQIQAPVRNLARPIQAAIDAAGRRRQPLVFPPG